MEASRTITDRSKTVNTKCFAILFDPFFMRDIGMLRVHDLTEMIGEKRSIRAGQVPQRIEM